MNCRKPIQNPQKETNLFEFEKTFAFKSSFH